MSFKVIGIGEVLWDLLPSGPQLGGAPANFAFHARQLGADARVITRVGNDAYGREILQRFEEMGIKDGTVQRDDRLPTGTATVAVDGSGVPQFVINRNAAWDNLSQTHEALAASRQADAVCFGTLAQRNAAAGSIIQQLVVAAPCKALKVLDVNLRPGFFNQSVVRQSLEIANVVKMNEHELGMLSTLFELTGDTRQKMEQLSRRFDLRLTALTRGANGSLLYQAGRCSDLPGGQVKVVDTVGAGDAFTAALVMGLLGRLGLEEIHQLAAEVAGYVCSHSGATPVLPKRLRAVFASHCTNA